MDENHGENVCDCCAKTGINELRMTCCGSMFCKACRSMTSKACPFCSFESKSKTNDPHDGGFDSSSRSEHKKYEMLPPVSSTVIKPILDPSHSKASIFCSQLRGGTVQLSVGDKAVQFDVHRQLLCSASAYFRAAFSGDWKESDGKMAFPEDEPSIFEFLIHWLYTGRINIVKDDSRIGMISNHLRLYVLADKLQVLEMLPLILDCMRKLPSMQYSYTTEIEYIYSNSEQSSELRHLVASGVARDFIRRPLTDEYLHPFYKRSFAAVPEFAVDMCKALRDAHITGKDLQDSLGVRSYHARAKEFKEPQDKAGPAVGSSDTPAS